MEPCKDRFVDVAPALVTNEASLTDLNSRLETPIPPDRFGPNMVIDGLEPYEEDRVVSLEGPGWRMERLTACERCAVLYRPGVGGAPSRTAEP